MLAIPNSPFIAEEIIDGEESAPPVKWRDQTKPKGDPQSECTSACAKEISIRVPRVRIEREHVYGYRVK
jgi:hypothetical protein